MAQFTPEAQNLLDALDAELAGSSERVGTSLSWTAAERKHLEMIASTVDRRVHLQRRYENTDPTDAKNLVRLSTELRLLSFFPTAVVESTFQDPIMPMASNVLSSNLNAPVVREITADELPPELQHLAGSGDDPPGPG